MDKPIDVNFEELEGIYTIDEVAKILNMEQSDIVFYYEKFNDFLNIPSVGAFQLFRESDIENLKRIKHLNYNLKMDIDDIIKYLNTNKQEILIEKKEKNEITINSFIEVMNRLCNTIVEQKNTIDNMQLSLEKVTQKQQSTDKKIDNISNDVILINNKFDDLKNEIAVTKAINEKEELVKYNMELRKKENVKNKFWVNILSKFR